MIESLHASNHVTIKLVKRWVVMDQIPPWNYFLNILEPTSQTPTFQIILHTITKHVLIPLHILLALQLTLNGKGLFASPIVFHKHYICYLEEVNITNKMNNSHQTTPKTNNKPNACMLTMIFSI